MVPCFSWSDVLHVTDKRDGCGQAETVGGETTSLQTKSQLWTSPKKVSGWVVGTNFEEYYLSSPLPSPHFSQSAELPGCCHSADSASGSCHVPLETCISKKVIRYRMTWLWNEVYQTIKQYRPSTPGFTRECCSLQRTFSPRPLPPGTTGRRQIVSASLWQDWWDSHPCQGTHPKSDSSVHHTPNPQEDDHFPHMPPKYWTMYICSSKVTLGVNTMLSIFYLQMVNHSWSYLVHLFQCWYRSVCELINSFYSCIPAFTIIFYWATE